MSSISDNELRRHRIGIYIDCIGGTISSVLSIVAIAVFSVLYGIYNISGFLMGLIFWIIWLCFSLLLIGIGLHSRKKEKEFMEKHL